MKPSREQKAISAAQKSWDREVTSRLPQLLEELLGSERYGRDNPPPQKYGVYLFVDGDRPMYVGRVGLTERSRRNGTRYSSFRTRLQGHRTASHSKGTWAFRRTIKVLEAEGIKLPKTRAAKGQDKRFTLEFKKQCEKIAKMDFLIVTLDENEDKLSAVFEVYAAHALGLDQSFAVS